jgi:hypothetical protein
VEDGSNDDDDDDDDPHDDSRGEGSDGVVDGDGLAPVLEVKAISPHAHKQVAHQAQDRQANPLQIEKSHRIVKPVLCTMRKAPGSTSRSCAQ